MNIANIVLIKPINCPCSCYSVTQSCPTLWPHGLQKARPLCPSPSPEVCPSSCPLHQWCHPAISTSDALLSVCPQSFPASGTFPMSQMFASDNQKTTVSASTSVLPMSIQGWFPLKLTGLISLLSKRLSGIFSCTTVWKHQLFGTLPSLWFISHNHMWLLWKIIALTIQTFVGRLMSLLVNTLSRFVIAFLPRRNCLLISWLQSTSAVILEPKNRKCHYFHLFPFYLP